MRVFALVGYSMMLFSTSCSQLFDCDNEDSTLDNLLNLVNCTCLETEIIVIRVPNGMNKSGYDTRTLRLLDSSCKPHVVDQHLEWKFRMTECGSRVQTSELSHLVTNVLSIRDDSGECDMVPVTCVCPIDDSEFVQNINQTFGVVMPRLRWTLFHIFETDLGEHIEDIQSKIKPSCAYVGDWAKSRYLMVKFETDGVEPLKVTLVSCLLHFVHSNGSDSGRQVQLLKQGCPIKLHENYFAYNKAFDSLSVVFVFNYFDEARSAILYDMKYAFITCSAAVCRPNEVDGYKNVPKCQMYYDPDYCTSSKNFGSVLLSNFSSGLLAIPYDKPTVMPTVTPTVTSTVLTTASVEGRDKDARISLEPIHVTLICVACFICGCSIIGLIWLVIEHKRRSGRSTIGSSLSSIKKNQSPKTCSKGESPSVDSGILDSTMTNNHVCPVTNLK